MSTARALPTFEAFAEVGRFMWVSTSGNVCRAPLGGCAGRNEQTAMLAQWMSRGLPRTGSTVCAGRCHCIVVPLIDFGLGVDESLDTGSSGFDTSDVKPVGRQPGTAFSDAPKGYGPQEFIDELESLPVVGLMRDEVASIVRALREGTIDLNEAKALADRHLLGLL